MTDATRPATQANLPVTPEDIETVAQIFEAERNKAAAWAVRSAGLCGTVHHDVAQVVARYRVASQAHSLPGDVGTDALRKALRPFANAAKWWKAFDNQHRITTLHQHGDCLEVGHLRAAAAALTPSSSSLFERKRDEIREAEQATPSALSGDAGEEIEKLLTLIETAHEHANEIWIVEQAARVRAALPSHKGAGE